MTRQYILRYSNSSARTHDFLFTYRIPKVLVLLAFLSLLLSSIATKAQSSASVPPKRGTVTTVSGNTITLIPDTGSTVTITVPDTAKVQQLAVGSADLKTAKPSQFSDIAVGDRVLAAVGAGETPDSFVARQVVLMKRAAIAEMQAAQQADWTAHGVGGIVNSVDAANGAITLTLGAQKVVVHTTGKTAFKRFSSDSVKYENSKPGTLAQIQAKDQLQARGAKSADGTSIEAEEVVSGTFLNLSGLIASIDTAAGKITLKDLATKKMMTVEVSANSDIRSLPLMTAMMLAARSGGGAGAYGGGMAGGMHRSAGEDLSQMMERLPASALANLKTDDAVMIVASEASPGASTVAAITLLSGVEPILTANPNGGMDLSMSLGGGGGGGE